MYGDQFQAQQMTIFLDQPNIHRKVTGASKSPHTVNKIYMTFQFAVNNSNNINITLKITLKIILKIILQITPNTVNFRVSRFYLRFPQFLGAWRVPLRGL